MSIFTDKAYAKADSNKHILNSIENNSTTELLIWRHPVKNFNTNSVLTVRPGEQALFYKNGQLVKIFESGRFELKTENYPFISDLRNLLSGGVSTFTSDVYFVRTTISMEILWGTDTPIQMRDPVQNIYTSLKGRGAYKIRIENAPLFISKVSGFIEEFTFDQINDFFFNEFLQHIKNSISLTLEEQKKELLGLSSCLNELASIIHPKLAKIFNQYGIELTSFNIIALDIPENDPNRIALEEAYRRKREFELFGKDYKVIKGMEILKDIANQSGAGGDLAAVGAGLGMGLSASKLIGALNGGLFADAQNKETDGENVVDKLKQLNILREQNLIDEDEYQNAKREILKQFID
ncbi:SPFH domain-containing protein [Succinatimonas hippei]|uniref:SPFH domain-containing protein n=1 Tax=Succinatimonas hippei TaxID=626938 RepID=UPI00248F538B|nr:SPFH domain-containing protein [Succinatimonas hippei]